MKTAEEIANELEGTCQSIGDVCEEGEDDDEALMREVDDLVFCCDACGWWFAAGDQDEQGRCEHCAEDAGDDE